MIWQHPLTLHAPEPLSDKSILNQSARRTVTCLAFMKKQRDRKLIYALLQENTNQMSVENAFVALAELLWMWSTSLLKGFQMYLQTQQMFMAR